MSHKFILISNPYTKYFQTEIIPNTNALDFHWLLAPCPAQMILMDEQGKRGCGQQGRPCELPALGDRIGRGPRNPEGQVYLGSCRNVTALQLKFPYCKKGSCVLLRGHEVGHGVALFSPDRSYICQSRRTKQAHSSSLTVSVLVSMWLILLQLCFFLTTASLHGASTIACKGTLQPVAAPVPVGATSHSSEEESGKPHVLPSV